jgi:hypothetical protein
MSRTAKLLALLAASVAPCAIAGAAPALADEVFKATAQVTVPGGVPMASWDISFVDGTLGLFFLGDRTHNAVDVVATGISPPGFVKFVGQGLFQGAVSGPTCIARGGGANDCSGPNGVITTNNNELWASDGDSTVKVFDLTDTTKAPIVIKTNGKFRGDEMCFNPDDQQIMVANNSQGETPSPFATIISVTTHKVVKRINFDGTTGSPAATNGAEQCSYSHETKRFYITLPGINTPDDGTGAVVVINPKKLNGSQPIEKVFKFKNTDCDTPQGTSVGPDSQLMVGCNGSTHATNSIIIKQQNGNILAKVAGESGPDEVWYNPGDGQYFLGISGGPTTATTQLLGVIDARGLRADVSVPTANKPNPPAASSHSVAADPVHNQVFVAIGGKFTGPPPGNSSTVCGKLGGDDTQGCIAVFTAENDDQGLPVGGPVKGKSGDDDHQGDDNNQQ